MTIEFVGFVGIVLIDRYISDDNEIPKNKEDGINDRQKIIESGVKERQKFKEKQIEKQVYDVFCIFNIDIEILKENKELDLRSILVNMRLLLEMYNNSA